MRRLTTAGLAAGLLLALVPLSTPPSSAAVTAPAAVDPSTPEGTYTPVEPGRLFDSRDDLGRSVRSGEVRPVQVTGTAGVPSSGVSAVVVNLTVTKPTKYGDLAAFPSDSTGSGVSSLNFAAGDTRAALATIPVGPDGAIKVRPTLASGGTTAVIVDVQGYYSTADAAPDGGQAGFFTTPPQRLIDTRTDAYENTPVAGFDPGYGYSAVYGDVSFFDDVNGDVATEDSVVAVSLNLTAVKPARPGYLAGVAGDAETLPDSSNVNFVAGKTTANNAVVPTSQFVDSVEDGGDGEVYSDFAIVNVSAGDTHVVADLNGYYVKDVDGDLRFEPLSSPVRIADSRTQQGLSSSLGANSTGTVTAPSTVATPGADGVAGATRALVGTITAVRPTAATFLTAWAFGEQRPTASNLNPLAGQTVANHLVVGLSDDGRFNVYNLAGRTDALVDVTGRFVVPGTPQTPSDLAAQRRRTAVTEPEVLHRDQRAALR